IQMPMLHERLKVLHEVGSKLVEKYNGSFVNCIYEADGSANKLLEIIMENFPAFRDVAEFKGKQVGIYKRAQILISDIWACCEGTGLGAFKDVDTITMFADYRIPQILVYFGALEYSDHLMDLLKKDTLFQSGDQLEVEIRGCSIWAVELIVREARELMAKDESLKDNSMNAIMVDHYLWDYRVAHAIETNHIPIHKIRCIYY
ncbi:unnamed protein product, partial [Owenia fusiformis]